MRELLISVEYEETVDPLMDVFRNHDSELTADALASCTDRDKSWLVERFEGPESALDQIKRIRCDPDAPREEMTATQCDASRQSHLLERSPTTLVVHTFVKGLHTCDSVIALAGRFLDPGFVVQWHRRGSRNNFRMLLQSDQNVNVFCERVEEHLKDGISFQFGRLGDVDWWSHDSLSPVTLPQEQRETLRMAVNEGYYETPRKINVGELAEQLEIPQSTASYRLRQAEAKLAKGYQNRFETDTVESRESAR